MLNDVARAPYTEALNKNNKLILKATIKILGYCVIIGSKNTVEPELRWSNMHQQSGPNGTGTIDPGPVRYDNIGGPNRF